MGFSMTDPASIRTGGYPLHHALTGFPTACFTGALLTDIVYWNTAEMQWANFSAWLLAFGLLMAAFAIVAGVVDAVMGWRLAGGRRPALVHVIGYILAVLAALLNSFVHSRDAYTSVVPLGLLLSLLTVVILSVTGWWGHEDSYRLETR
jgi:uncharacterized membrane protein